MSGILPELTPDDLLEQQRRIHPPHQVASWDGVPAGEAVYAAIAAAMGRVAKRAAQSGEARLIMEATGPTKARGSVTVTFAGGIPSGYNFAVRSGQMFAATKWGERFALAADLVVTGPQSPGYSITVAVQSEWANSDANVAAADITEWALAAGVDPSGDIDFDLSASTLLGVGYFVVGVADGTITVLGATDATGGSDGTLDLIGSGRGIPRASGESDAAYRKRIRSLQDTLTPAAMLRAANRALERYGLTATYLEAGDYGWAIGHATRGCPTVSPPSRLRHFVLLIPALDRNPLGWAIGHAVNGCPTVSPIGTGDVEISGLLGGLQVSVNSIKPAGIWGSVVEGSSNG